jgi:AbrB family looped-hinge helix DNA binding protein
LLAELRDKAQITLPKPICKKLNLSKGDTFDVVVDKDGVIHLVPVVVRSKEYVQSLEENLEKYDKESLKTLRKAEALRAKGAQDLSIDEFEANMRKAIAEGAGSES